MGEPEPERCREAKQRLLRTQGAGIGPKLCPGPEDRLRKDNCVRDNPSDLTATSVADRSEDQTPLMVLAFGINRRTTGRNPRALKANEPPH
jgi:hypothetical protein